MKRVELSISGKVQGVGFRGSTKQTARRLGLTGYVKNCSDGTVTVVAEGDDDALERLIDFCEEGPRFADVTRVEVNEREYADAFGSFSVRY